MNYIDDANLVAPVDALLVHERSHGHDIQRTYLLPPYSLLNHWVIFISSLTVYQLFSLVLMFVPLDDFSSAFVSVHDGHVQVHENQTVPLLAALLVEVVVLEHVQRLEPVRGLVAAQTEVHLEDQLQGDQVEAVVVHDQDLAFASAVIVGKARRLMDLRLLDKRLQRVLLLELAREVSGTAEGARVRRRQVVKTARDDSHGGQQVLRGTRGHYRVDDGVSYRRMLSVQQVVWRC